MQGTLINMRQIFSPTKFQKIQDDISLATGLAIITVDYTGVPLTAHSNCSEFCKRIRSSYKYRDYCEKCDSHGGLEAARIGKPFIYFCHAGLVDFAIPVISDNLYLGAFMAGQVILDKKDSVNELEHILPGAGSSIASDCDKAIRDSYKLLPVMNLEKITALSNMLAHIANYCVEEAMLRNAVAQLNYTKNIIGFYSKTENETEKIYHAQGQAAEYQSKTSNRVLQPALDYIKYHCEEKITLSKMSALCNVSASYFSKLFARENLGSLSDYVNRMKVERAKELLHSTGLPIRCIAENLGFEDCGYFIKVFKANAGRTPAEFRKRVRAL